MAPLWLAVAFILGFAVKVLEEKDEMGALHGRVAIGKAKILLFGMWRAGSGAYDFLRNHFGYRF